MKRARSFLPPYEFNIVNEYNCSGKRKFQGILNVKKRSEVAGGGWYIV
jgi:hypothetical protein